MQRIMFSPSATGKGPPHWHIMNGGVARDVVRLILRFLPTPYEARGLLGANHFWRHAMATYYEAGARKALNIIHRVPTYHTLRVVSAQMAYASAETMVVLDVLWSRHEHVKADAVRLSGLHGQEANVLREALSRVTARQAQIAERRWGVKRVRSRKLVVTESDEDWTRRMLIKAEREYDKVKSTNIAAKLLEQWKKRDEQARALHEYILEFYAPTGAVGKHLPKEEPWRFLAQYPHATSGVKRRVDDARLEMERAEQEARELNTKMHKACEGRDREEWPKFW